MPSGVYQLPNLTSICPKKSGFSISPHFQEAKNGYEKWVKENMGYFAAIGVSNAEMPLLAALSWPTASCKELRAILDYMTMSFMLEVLTDRASIETSKKVSKLWIDVLKDPQAGQGHRDPFIKLMTTQMVARLKDAVDPFHWPEFVQSNVDFAMNTVQEAQDREASKNVSATRCIASYMVMRRETVGTRPCIVLMRSIRKLYLPENVLQNPVVAEMENTALDMVFFANDLYSFKKELDENGALNNILTVIQKDPITQHLDLQERIDYVGRLFQTAMDRFNACKDALPRFGDEEIDRQVAAFADGLMVWVLGSIEWSIANRRYHVFVNDHDSRNNILRLEDRWFMSNRFRLLLLFISIIITYISFLMM